MLLTPPRLVALIACSLIGVCSAAQAQSEAIVPRVRITDDAFSGSSRTFQDCSTPEELGYKPKQLSELSLDIRLTAELMPADCSTSVFRTASATSVRNWAETEFNWAATDLFHQPAYFDDPILERYGQSHHRFVQPFLSGAHFFAQFPLMPYKMGLDRTHDHVYTLGYYRPGSPTPLLGRRLPLEADAASFEAMGWVALFLIFP